MKIVKFGGRQENFVFGFKVECILAPLCMLWILLRKWSTHGVMMQVLGARKFLVQESVALTGAMGEVLLGLMVLILKLEEVWNVPQRSKISTHALSFNECVQRCRTS
jgi:hypothetical protein